MKLKRPSGANDYDSLADMDGEGHVSTLQTPMHRRLQTDHSQSPHGTPHSLTPPERGASLGADFSVKPVNLKKRKSSTHLSLSDGEDVYPPKRAYSTMPISRNGSPRKALKSIYPAGPTSLETPLPLPSHAHHVSPPPVVVSESGRAQMRSYSSTELANAASPTEKAQSPAPVNFTAVNTVGFTAVNNAQPDREPLREAPHAVSKERKEDASMNRNKFTPGYTSPYESTSRISETAPRLAESRPVTTTSPPTHESRPSSSGRKTNGVNGTSAWQSPSMKHAQHAYSAPQSQSLPPLLSHSKSAIQIHSNPQPPTPPYRYSSAPSHSQAHPQQLPTRSNSRTNTPVPCGSRSIAPQPPSRSGSPLAQVANNQPTQAPDTHQTYASRAHSATQYGTQLVHTQEPTVSTRDHRAPVVQASHGHPQFQHSYQTVLKSQGSDYAQTVHTPPVAHRSAVSTHDIRLLQYEVTAGLFTFFFPRSAAPPDESALLQRLHTLWYHGEALFRAELGSHFDLISKILTSWLHERQAITALRHSLASQPGVSPVGLVDRLLAMNDLRVMRLKWKNMSTVDGLSPEDLLCQAFRVMTSTEGSESLFKDGLERLNTGLFEFLKSEDAKIVMQRG